MEYRVVGAGKWWNMTRLMYSGPFWTMLILGSNHWFYWKWAPPKSGKIISHLGGHRGGTWFGKGFEVGDRVNIIRVEDPEG